MACSTTSTRRGETWLSQICKQSFVTKHPLMYLELLQFMAGYWFCCCVPGIITLMLTNSVRSRNKFQKLIKNVKKVWKKVILLVFHNLEVFEIQCICEEQTKQTTVLHNPALATTTSLLLWCSRLVHHWDKISGVIKICEKKKKKKSRHFDPSGTSTSSWHSMKASVKSSYYRDDNDG